MMLIKTSDYLCQQCQLTFSQKQTSHLKVLNIIILSADLFHYNNISNHYLYQILTIMQKIDLLLVYNYYQTAIIYNLIYNRQIMNNTFLQKFFPCLISFIALIIISNGQISACDPGYYYNPSTGFCQQVIPNCKTFIAKNGTCQACNVGYVLASNTCLISKSFDPCLQYGLVEDCLNCTKGYYINRNKTCSVSDPLCQNYDPSNGNCFLCYSGYILSNGKCAKQITCRQGYFLDAAGNCQIIVCKDRFYLDSSGNCQSVDPNCKTYNNKTGSCLTCYSGYNLTNGKCILNSVTITCPQGFYLDATGFCMPTVPNPKTCPSRYYLDTNNLCQPVDSSCNTYNTTTGACKSCKLGLILNQGKCLYTSPDVIDPNCISMVGGSCNACTLGFYLSKSKTCVQVNKNCKTYSSINGQCTTCFDRYSLYLGQCISSSINPCKMGYHLVSSGVCEQIDPAQINCPNRYYLDWQGICQPVDPKCTNYNDKTGACLSCNAGYDLRQGTCVSGTPPSSSCSSGYFRNILGICEKNPTSDSCPSGFFRNSIGNCELIDASTISTNPPLSCKDGFFRNTFGNCQAVNPLCRTYNLANGLCTSCYDAYSLNQGNCLINTLAFTPPFSTETLVTNRGTTKISTPIKFVAMTSSFGSLGNRPDEEQYRFLVRSQNQKWIRSQSGLSFQVGENQFSYLTLQQFKEHFLNLIIPLNVPSVQLDFKNQLLNAFQYTQDQYQYLFGDSYINPNFRSDSSRLLVAASSGLTQTPDVKSSSFSSSSSSNPSVSSSSSSNSSTSTSSSSNRTANPLSTPSSPKFTPPTLSIEWTSKGAVTPVQNQASCGGCYAFSTTASIESAYLIKNQINHWAISLTIQQIIDCSSAYGNNGCQGGWYDASFLYVKDKGLTKYSSYPYNGNTNGCNINFGEYKISSYKGGLISGCSALAAMLVTNPVSIGISAGSQYWKNYQGGVLDRCNIQIDHGLLLVGLYQNSFTRQNYWKLKNSWGTQWGESGFIRISRQNGGNLCNICKYGYYPII